jgi:hypothetical protein
MLECFPVLPCYFPVIAPDFPCSSETWLSRNNSYLSKCYARIFYAFLGQEARFPESAVENDEREKTTLERYLSEEGSDAARDLADQTHETGADL